MRVHGDKTIERRKGITRLNHYSDARDILEEDFHFLCGYCGKNGKIMHQKFHIDHFVPKSLDSDRENDYYNLVLACPKCNLSKSDKWPTEDINVPNDGKTGFVDPATKQFDEHIERNSEGFVVGITPVGENMCSMLNIDIRRTDLYWKIDRIRKIEDQLEELFWDKKLSDNEKDFYIIINSLLKSYIDEAFDKGE